MSTSASVSISITSAVRNGTGAVNVRGSATPGVRATVNGAPVVIASDGTWSADVAVGPGPTTVTAAAVSADGRNRSSSSVTIGA